MRVDDFAAQLALLPEGRGSACRLLVQLSRDLGGPRILARAREHEHVRAEAPGALRLD